MGDFHPHPVDLEKREVFLGGQEYVFLLVFPNGKRLGVVLNESISAAILRK
jgi:hypothetical protein